MCLRYGAMDEMHHNQQETIMNKPDNEPDDGSIIIQTVYYDPITHEVGVGYSNYFTTLSRLEQANAIEKIEQHLVGMRASMLHIASREDSKH